jgi:shikimate kinase
MSARHSTQAGTADNIVLIGPMGSGKTAVAKALARLLGWSFVDCDALVEKRTGVDIAYIFEKEGEAGFRVREAELMQSLLGSRHSVFATGGGVVLREQNQACLPRLGYVVYLRTSVAEQVRRTQKSTHRPLLRDVDPVQRLTELMAIRAPLYERLAHLTVDTDQAQAAAVAQRIYNAYQASGLTDKSDE